MRRTIPSFVVRNVSMFLFATITIRYAPTVFVWCLQSAVAQGIGIILFFTVATIGTHLLIKELST